jgi:hypothetical protein
MSSVLFIYLFVCFQIANLENTLPELKQKRNDKIQKVSKDALSHSFFLSLLYDFFLALSDQIISPSLFSLGLGLIKWHV